VWRKFIVTFSRIRDTQRLRQKGYTIPQRITQASSYQKQEVVCLDISQSISTGMEDISPSTPWTARASVLRLDFHGTQIDISNRAAQQTITNALLAMKNLC
jgi:hypothetical protein